jgi:hypothetical protein
MKIRTGATTSTTARHASRLRRARDGDCHRIVAAYAPAVADWVGFIVFSDEIQAKLRQKHGITPEQVAFAIGFGRHDSAVWDDDPRYGRRLILTGSDDEGELVAYLRPLDREDGRWECLTAWRI